MRSLALLLGMALAPGASAQVPRIENLSGLSEAWAVCPVHDDKTRAGKFWLEVIPDYRSSTALLLSLTPLDELSPLHPVKNVRTIESGDVKVYDDDGKTMVVIVDFNVERQILMTVAYKGGAAVSADISIKQGNRQYGADCIIIKERERSLS